MSAFTHALIRERVEQPHPQCYDQTPRTVREYLGMYAGEGAAVKNAEELARLNPGNKYLVCEVVSISETKPVTTTLRAQSRGADIQYNDEGRIPVR